MADSARDTTILRHAMTDTTLSDLVHADKTTPSIWPGLALAAMIAALAFALRYLPGVGMLSPLILAILLGMALRNTLGTPEVAKAGLAISMRPVLRAGIILMGLQLTLGQVAAVGWVGVAVIALSLVLTFGFTTWLGRVLGVDAKLTQLIAAGTSIAAFEAAMGAQSPIIRAMPNTPAAVGRGITAIIGNSHASAAHLDMAEELLRALLR